MKRTFIKAFLLAVMAAVLASCFPDMEYMYTDTSMCTYVSSTTLKTDAGEIYHITSNNSGANMPDTLKRVMVRVDVLNRIEGTSNEYNVRLMEFAGAMVQTPLTKSTMDEEAVGNDGVSISTGWISGGYFNAYVYIAMLRPTNVHHVVNLVFDDARSDADNVYFELRHNAYDECPENPSIPLASFEFAGAYMSFPLDGILESGKTPVVHLEWDWYDGEEYNYTRTKSRRSGEISIL